MKSFLNNALIVSALLLPVVWGVHSAAAVGVVSQFCNNPNIPAASNTSVCTSVAEQDAAGTNPVIHIIKVAIEVISYIVGIAAIITIVVSGIRFVISGGDSNAVAAARNGLVYALVGIAIVALAQVIVVYVLDKLK